MSDAEDDLDAFFDEVTTAEEEAKKELVKSEQHQTEEALQPPPSKKTKLESSSTANENNNNVKVLVKRVAAQAAPTTADPPLINSTSSDANTTSSNNTIPLPPPIPPPPPPPPLPEQQNDPSIGSTGGYNNGRNNMNSGVPHMMNGAPPLPPPPPPPPLPRQDAAKFTKRSAAGKSWVDPTLSEWPANDFRLFVGNLAKDIKRDQLEQLFREKYNSVAMAKIVYDKHNNKSKGFGFVSFLDPMEAAKAMREMNEVFLGSRPMKVKKSEWMERDSGVVKKGLKQKARNKRRR